MRIIYMGTPDFACAPLRALLEARHEIQAVFCQPDRPKGRGMKRMAPPVKMLAQSNGIPVYQPESFRDHAALPVLEQYQPDAIVVAAYGRILPPYVLRAPRYGCINVHASLLPKYRGAAPIQYAILNGERETGVTIMHMARKLDAGDMILSEKLEIGEYETAGALTQRLSELGAQLLCRALAQLEEGTAQCVAQDDAAASYAPVITRADARPDFSRPVCEVCNRVRAMQPAPGAYAEANGSIFKIPVLYAVGETTSAEPGTVLGLDEKGRLRIACADGIAAAPEIQAPSSRRMPCADYARGHALPEKFA